MYCIIQYLTMYFIILLVHYSFNYLQNKILEYME